MSLFSQRRNIVIASIVFDPPIYPLLAPPHRRHFHAYSHLSTHFKHINAVYNIVIARTSLFQLDLISISPWKPALDISSIWIYSKGFLEENRALSAVVLIVLFGFVHGKLAVISNIIYNILRCWFQVEYDACKAYFRSIGRRHGGPGETDVELFFILKTLNSENPFIGNPSKSKLPPLQFSDSILKRFFIP